MVRKGYERVMCERWVGDWTKTPKYWPPALLATAALQPLNPNFDLQQTRSSCGTGLYNCLLSTCFSERRICTQFNPSTVKVIPWYLRPDAPVIYTGASLIWQLGRVGGQYVTNLQTLSYKSYLKLFHRVQINETYLVLKCFLQSMSLKII